MKVLAWLLMAALPAVAQPLPINPCTGLPGTDLYTDLQTTPFNDCVFQPFGGTPREAVQTFATDGVTSLGWLSWWHCPQPNGGWSTPMFVASSAVFTQAYYIQIVNDIGVGVAISPTPAAALADVISKRITLPLSDPSLAAVWCPHTKEFHVLPPLRPAVDGTLVPPWPWLVAGDGATWSILPTGFAARNDTATNGHATAIELKAGNIYVKSPTGGFWWQWLGPNQWVRLTTAQP